LRGLAAKEQTHALGPVLTFLSEWWALNHAIEKTSKRMQARIGVTAQQRMLVRVIGAFPGIMSGQLARVVHLDPGTISTAIGRLEHAGLVARRRDGSDGRSVSLELTARGRSLDVPDPQTIEGALARALKQTARAQTAGVRAFIARFIDELEAEPRQRASVRPGSMPNGREVASVRRRHVRNGFGGARSSG
jgi:DNA-binding MarR family transcriptional regulator